MSLSQQDADEIASVAHDVADEACEANGWTHAPSGLAIGADGRTWTEIYAATCAELLSEGPCDWCGRYVHAASCGTMAGESRYTEI